jgi:hypothetical protein
MPIAIEQPPPPLQGVVVIQRHLIIAVDGCHHLALSLAGVRAGVGTPGPPATSALGICTLQDSSPFCRVAMTISSKVCSSCSRILLVVWSENKGVRSDGDVMKSVEDGSGPSFPSRVLCMSGAKLDPGPCSSRVASSSPLYCHAGWTLN